MLVRMCVGPDAGALRDVLPESAHAMLADGRAVLPDVLAAPALAPARVVSREDRGMPRGKRRAVR